MKKNNNKFRWFSFSLIAAIVSIAPALSSVSQSDVLRKMNYSFKDNYDNESAVDVYKKDVKTTTRTTSDGDVQLTKTFKIDNNNKMIEYNYHPDVIRNVDNIYMINNEIYANDFDYIKKNHLIKIYKDKLGTTQRSKYKISVRPEIPVYNDTGSTWKPGNEYARLNFSTVPEYKINNSSFHYWNLDKAYWRNHQIFYNNDIRNLNGKIIEGGVLLRTLTWWGQIIPLKDPWQRFYFEWNSGDIGNAYQFDNLYNQSFTKNNLLWSYTNGAPSIIVQWVIGQLQFALHDGFIWLGSYGQKASIRKRSLNISKDDFMQNVTAQTISSYFIIDSWNTPGLVYSIDGKQETVVTITDDQASEVVRINVVAPRSYKPNVSVRNAFFNINEFTNPVWISQNDTILNLDIKYSEFNSQSSSSVYTIIDVNNISPLIDGINKYSYAIDLYSLPIWQSKLIESINRSPQNYMTNVPSKSETLERPIVNPNAPVRYEMVDNGDAIEVSLELLLRTTNPGQPAEYTPSNFKLIGFSSVETSVYPIPYDVYGKLSKLLPSSISAQSEELINFLKEKKNITNIFNDISNVFVNTNHVSLSVTRILNANDQDGTLDVEVEVSNAKIENSVNGYGRKKMEVKLRNFAKIQESTTIKEVLDIRTLDIPGIEDTTYSIDVINDSSNFLVLQQNIVAYLNNFNNIDKVFNSSPTLDQVANRDIVKVSNFKLNDNNQTDIDIELEYLAYDQNKKTTNYKKGKLTLTGFNKKNTALITQAASGIVVPGLDKFNVSDCASTNVQFIIKQFISNNLSLLFENYSSIFITTNLFDNILLELVNIDSVSSEARFNVSLSSALVGNKYLRNDFRIIIKGFAPTSNITYIKALTAMDLKNEILRQQPNNSDVFGNLDNKYAFDLCDIRSATNTALVYALNSVINNNPHFFFGNYATDSSLPAIQLGSSISVNQGQLPNSININGLFKFKNDLGEITYQELNIPVYGFNMNKTEASSNQIENILRMVGIDKNLISSIDAAIYLNSTFSNELIKLLNENVNTIFQETNNNLPEWIIKNKNNLFNRHRLNVRTDGLDQLVIEITNILISDDKGKVHEGILSIPIKGFVSKSKNTELKIEKVSAIKNSEEFQRLFDSTDKGFEIDWMNDKESKEQKLTQSLNNRTNYYFKNQSNKDKPVYFTDINVVNTNNISIAYADVYYNGYKRGIISTIPIINTIDIELKPNPKMSEFYTSFDKYVTKEYIKLTGPKSKKEAIANLKMVVNNWISSKEVWRLLPDAIINIDPIQRVYIDEKLIDYDIKTRKLIIKKGAIIIGDVNKLNDPNSYHLVYDKELIIKNIPGPDEKPIFPNPDNPSDNQETISIDTDKLLWLYILVPAIAVAIIAIIVWIKAMSRRRKFKKSSSIETSLPGCW